MAKNRMRKDMPCVLTFLVDAIEQEEKEMHDGLVTDNTGQEEKEHVCRLCPGSHGTGGKEKGHDD